MDPDVNQPTVLLYNMPEDRLARIAGFAQQAGIQPFAVPSAAYLQPLGALCGIQGFHEKAYEGEGFPEEMMFMAHFEKGQLNRFLDAFHATGEKPVALKAMLTVTNAAWDSLTLREELSQEWAYFRSLKQQSAAQQEDTPPEPREQ